MKHVDIYLENAGKSVKKKEGWYGYVLAYQGTFGRLAHYRENGWMKSDGTEIKYKELWQQVSDAAVGKEITFRMGTHEFSGWLQREIQHKEENKDV